MARVSGHFGEWMQGRLGPDGPVAVVTVPCEVLGCTVAKESESAGVNAIWDAPAIRQFLDELGADHPSPGFRFEPEAPVGGGAGMSTAALLGAAHTMGVAASPEDLAAACLAVEGAVDPLMLAAPGDVLWAPREARLLQTFGPLPDFTIVGGFWGAPERTDPNDQAFADIADLVPMWAAAVQRQDRAALAGLATEAFRRTTALRGPKDDPTLEIATDMGALGVLRAHTGSARGLIYPGEFSPELALDTLKKRGYADLVWFGTGTG